MKRAYKFIDTVLRHTQRSFGRDGHAAAKPEETGLSTRDYAAIYEQVKPYTMVPEAGVAFVVHETIRLIESNVPGVRSNAASGVAERAWPCWLLSVFGWAG